MMSKKSRCILGLCLFLKKLDTPLDWALNIQLSMKFFDHPFLNFYVWPPTQNSGLGQISFFVRQFINGKAC